MGQPTFSGSNRNSGVLRRVCERHILFKVWPENIKPLHCKLALLFSQNSSNGLGFIHFSHRFNNLCFCTVRRAQHKNAGNAPNLVAKLWCKRYGA
jgi:hypothetical protein